MTFFFFGFILPELVDLCGVCFLFYPIWSPFPVRLCYPTWSTRTHRDVLGLPELVDLFDVCFFVLPKLVDLFTCAVCLRLCCPNWSTRTPPEVVVISRVSGDVFFPFFFDFILPKLVDPNTSRCGRDLEDDR